MYKINVYIKISRINIQNKYIDMFEKLNKHKTFKYVKK